MSWRTNGFVVALRDVGRAMGLNRRIAVLLHGTGYEVSYDTEFSKRLGDGDRVWDIGANVGYYTRAFATRVGERGAVYAFEPSEVNFKRLEAECSDLSNVKLFRCGLGNREGHLTLLQGSDDLGATSRIMIGGNGGDLVPVTTGDMLLAKGVSPAPTAIKIDVEGFEWEVLDGMSGVLGRNDLRLIGIEVHFGILKERGLGGVPQQLEGLLQAAGFRVQWPDSSHILASRDA